MKNIQFSRHAKRRMRLYNLSEDIVITIIQQQKPNFHFSEGRHEIVSDRQFSQKGYPIKVVFASETQKILVITAYPLKKGKSL